MLNAAHLFERPRILLDWPVLIMELEKRETIESGPVLVIRLIQRIMARLVFQPRPKHFDRAESPEVNEQAVFGNHLLLHR